MLTQQEAVFGLDGSTSLEKGVSSGSVPSVKYKLQSTFSGINDSLDWSLMIVSSIPSYNRIDLLVFT